MHTRKPNNAKTTKQKSGDGNCGEEILPVNFFKDEFGIFYCVRCGDGKGNEEKIFEENVSN